MMKINFLEVLVTNTLRPFTLVVAAFLLPGLAISADPLDKLSPDLKEELAYTTGVQAFIYAYPLLHVNHFRYLFNGEKSPKYNGPANSLNHIRVLESGKNAAAASPNHDTLYTLAFVDLTEPFVFDVPAMSDRYYTIQLADAYATNFGDIGTRHNKGAAGKYMVVGPDWKGRKPYGVKKIFHSPTTWAMPLIRILVDNENELEQIHMMQDKFKFKRLDGSDVVPLSAASVPSTLEPLAALPSLDSSTPADFWAIINREFTSNPPPPADKELVDQFAVVGIGPGQSVDLSGLDPAIQKGLKRAVITGMKIVTSFADDITGGASINGWGYSQANMGRYATDYLYRAGVTRMGLMANDPIEATYLSLYTDSNGKALSGGNKYSINFAADNLPPAQAFWSITMYDSKTYSLVENSMGRFSLGDRSPGLSLNQDKSLTLYVSYDTTDEEHLSNWLPAPPEGFYLIMRVYIPEDSVVQQTWAPPPLELTANGKAWVKR